MSKDYRSLATRQRHRRENKKFENKHIKLKTTSEEAFNIYYDRKLRKFDTEEDIEVN